MIYLEQRYAAVGTVAFNPLPKSIQIHPDPPPRRWIQRLAPRSATQLAAPGLQKRRQNNSVTQQA